MLTSKYTPNSEIYPTPEDATERMQMRGELFKLLNSGFGQRIANKMSAQIVNTLDDAMSNVFSVVVSYRELNELTST